MTVDELMSVLEESHYQAEALILIDQKAYTFSKRGTMDDVTLFALNEEVDVNPTFLKLCTGDLE